MNKPSVIFIAGERQHAGKTVASLGIISALSKQMDPKDIGYFKPVGQELVKLPSGERIDKDVRIVQEFTGLEMPDLAILSPVRVVDGVTRDYIAADNPNERTRAFEQAVVQAKERLSHKKIIIAEGTGHPGVGSVIGMSNAHVANLLDAKILYLVGGGIGRTMDELEVDLSYFAHHHSHVGGVLFNKVLPSKVESMRAVVNEKLLKRTFPEWDPALGVFGYMPTVDYLNNPSMQLLAKSFREARIIENSDRGAWQKPCQKVNVITQGSDSFVPEGHLAPRDIAVLGAASHRRLKRVLDFNATLPNEKLGGIILTCAKSEMPNAIASQWLAESGIPTLAVTADAGEVDQVVYKAFTNTKLQLYDKQKHEQIVQLFETHFDVQRFMNKFVR